MIIELFESGFHILFDDTSLFITIIVLMLSLLIMFPSYMIVFVREKRTSNVQTNIWHQAADRYENSNVARVLVIIGVFSPSILIFIVNLLLTTNTIIENLLTSAPWSLLSLACLSDFWAEKLCPSNNSD